MPDPIALLARLMAAKPTQVTGVRQFGRAAAEFNPLDGALQWPVIKPETLPPMLYHASPYTREIEGVGALLGAPGVKEAFAGALHPGVSLSPSPELAITAARDLNRARSVAAGEHEISDVLDAWMKRDKHLSAQVPDEIKRMRAPGPEFDRPAGEDPFQNYFDYVEGLKRHETSPERLKNQMFHGYMTAREDAGLQQNPVFARDLSHYDYVDPTNLGVVAVPRDLLQEMFAKNLVREGVDRGEVRVWGDVPLQRGRAQAKIIRWDPRNYWAIPPAATAGAALGQQD